MASSAAATPAVLSFAPGDGAESPISPSMKAATIRISVCGSCSSATHSASTPASRRPSAGSSSAIDQKMTEAGAVGPGQRRLKAPKARLTQRSYAAPVSGVS